MSACDLLAPPADRHDVDVPPALLVDLHAPDLVITPHYVGPRLHPDEAPPPQEPGPTGGPRWRRGYEPLVVALVSFGIAVPLTLLASH